MTTRIVITDEADDEHYSLECRQYGCLTSGRILFTLPEAGSRARDHAIATGHAVEILDAR